MRRAITRRGMDTTLVTGATSAIRTRGRRMAVTSVSARIPGVDGSATGIGADTVATRMRRRIVLTGTRYTAERAPRFPAAMAGQTGGATTIAVVAVSR